MEANSMVKRFFILSLLVFIFLNSTPAYAGVFELSEEIYKGSINDDKEPVFQNLSGIAGLTSDADYVRSLYLTLLNREGEPDGFGNWLTALNSGRLTRAQVRQAFIDSPEYRGLHGNNANNQPADTPDNNADTAGDLYGYNRQYFGPVWDIVMKYAEANRAYVYAAGHNNQQGYASQTDCSGFVGSVYQKLAAASGVKPSKNYGNANSYTLSGTQKITSQYPPPNPRDLIKPGDIMVTSGGGHIVMFMGYDRSGNPLIAHSTPGTIKSSAIAGNVGRSGVRIEVMPSYMRTNVSDRYPGQTPFKGVYRINGTEEMLKTLASK
jgi:cell wall-associated NlpC family hydrolase